MSCMLCQKSGRIFNVYTNYGNANHTVRDDFIEIFGVNVESYLTPSNCVCNVCMNMLDNVAKLKRRLWPLICNSNEDCKPIKLGKIWDIFASLKFDEDELQEDHTATCRSSTPNLLALNYSRVYNHNLEDKIAIIERHRSQSITSSGFGRSNASETSEIKNIFSRRKKKKSHKWTHQKRHATSRATSVSSRSLSTHSRRAQSHSDWDRSYSPLSDCSYVSYYTLKKSPVRRKGVEYDEHGRLIRKRTRSVSRAQEKEAKYLEKLESSKFYCDEKDCPLYFEDLDVLNQHRIIDHDILALHYCEECQQRYTKLEHLKVHKKCHDIYSFLCPLCACEIKNQEALQEHLEEHMVYSVPCKYCDKSYLSKKARENHSRITHRSKRERVVFKEKIILDRFDKNEETNENTDDVNKKKYTVYMMLHTDMEYCSGDFDVTTENLKLAGIDFISDEISNDIPPRIEDANVNFVLEPTEENV